LDLDARAVIADLGNQDFDRRACLRYLQGKLAIRVRDGGSFLIDDRNVHVRQYLSANTVFHDSADGDIVCIIILGKGSRPEKEDGDHAKENFLERLHVYVMFLDYSKNIKFFGYSQTNHEEPNFFTFYPISLLSA
jgi:hypothetical protein